MNAFIDAYSESYLEPSEVIFELRGVHNVVSWAGKIKKIYWNIVNG